MDFADCCEPHALFLISQSLRDDDCHDLEGNARNEVDAPGDVYAPGGCIIRDIYCGPGLAFIDVMRS